MKLFEEPSIDVVEMVVEDIIATSSDPGLSDVEDGLGWH